MTGLAVTGFASLDYPVGLDGFARPDETTRISRRDERAWPRIGGCPSFVAMAAARLGVRASPVTWVGSDDDGARYARRMAKIGVAPEGIATVPNARSPASVLVYQHDGSCICLYDPAFAGRESLEEAQRAVISEASHLCVTVGPPHLLEAILSLRSADAHLSWVVKNDPLCFPPALRDRLAAEADTIFCNQAERKLLGDGGRPGRVIVETHGSREVIVECAGERRSCEVRPLAAGDTTGAGDTLAGGFLAALMRGERDPVAAAAAGIRTVRDLLLTREEKEDEDI